MSVKEIDEYITNGLAAPVAPAPSPQSIVKPVAATTDDDKNSNVEMIDNDEDNDNEVNETGAKTATIEPEKKHSPAPLLSFASLRDGHQRISTLSTSHEMISIVVLRKSFQPSTLANIPLLSGRLLRFPLPLTYFLLMSQIF